MLACGAGWPRSDITAISPDRNTFASFSWYSDAQIKRQPLNVVLQVLSSPHYLSFLSAELSFTVIAMPAHTCDSFHRRFFGDPPHRQSPAADADGNRGGG